VLLAQVQEVRVPLADQVADQDLTIRVEERHAGRRLRVAMHLGACTHARRLDHTHVIFKHSAKKNAGGTSESA
jgi:hypothetical protein